MIETQFLREVVSLGNNFKNFFKWKIVWLVVVLFLKFCFNNLKNYFGNYVR